MPTPKTDKEIEDEIATLIKIKPTVRHYSGFGDDHHASIDSQIKALTERMDEDDVCNEWPEEQGEDARLRDSAMEVVNWMNGYEEISPVKNWSPLIQKTDAPAAPIPAPVPAKKKRAK